MAPRTRLRAFFAALAFVVLAAATAYAALPQQSGTVDLLTQTDFRIDGAAAGNVFGELSSPAGDVNGDGRGDVIVATTGSGPWVVFGRAANVKVSDPAFGGFHITGSDFSAGSPVTGVGDLNGDGLDDVLVGTPAVDRAWVVFGRTDGTPVNLAALGSGGYMLQGVAAEAAGHWVASAPDMNGDGKRELIIGADGAGRNGRSGSGSTYVVFGRSGTSTVDLNALGSGGFRIDGAQANHFSGGQVAGGPDVNGDGVGDILVGAPGAAYSFAAAGAVYVVFGKSTTTNVDLANVDAGNGGFRIDGQRANDALPRSLAVLPDMNGDGLGELAVGADFADNPTAGDSSAGSVWVVFGKSSTTNVALASLSSGGFRIDGQKAGDQFARSLGSAGDINGDGIPDLIAGALNADNNGRTDSGSAYVIFGRSATSTIATSALGSSGFRMDGAGAGDFLGRSSNAAGDFNGDGRPDVIAGAEFADNNGSNSGSAYIQLGFGQPAFSYSPASIAATVGTAITPLVATGVKATGAPTFTVTPSLPGGLSLDAATGTISGTPLVASPDTPYTVTLTDKTGTATSVVNIAVAGGGAPVTPITTPVVTKPPAGACKVKKTGTKRADKLMGTAAGDLIRGGAGNDKLNGLGGDDCLFGQAGNDALSGGPGKDKLDGGPGADKLSGGPGKDTLTAGAGNDTIVSKDGVTETVNCGTGRDKVKADKSDKLIGCEKRT